MTTKAVTASMGILRVAPHDSRNLTVTHYDVTAEVYEVYADADCDSYLGCADTLREARQIAIDWMNEQ